MSIKKKKKIPYGQILLHIIFIVTCLTYILPFVLLLSISFSNEDAIAQYGYTIFPKVFDTSAYKMIFENPGQLINSYITTITFTAITVFLSLVFKSLLAYPLSRSTFKFKKVITIFLTITMMFGGGLIPTYIIYTKILHLGNTIWVYILPTLVSAWDIVIIRTFFQGIPESLPESAKIDGASELRIYFNIMLPLSTPVLATIGFTTMIGKWNDWNTALIYIRDSKLFSLQYMLQKILREVDFVEKMATENSQLAEYSVPKESMRYAMAMLAAGPMLVVFPFFQKYFVKGMTVGAVKG